MTNLLKYFIVNVILCFSYAILSYRIAGNHYDPRYRNTILVFCFDTFFRNYRLFSNNNSQREKDNIFINQFRPIGNYNCNSIKF
jgi:hypothetical protein